MPTQLNPDAIYALVNGNHGAPGDILGPHKQEDGNTIIRTLRPNASTVSLVKTGTEERLSMERVREEGLFAITVKGDWPAGSYHFETITMNGHEEICGDPYAFPTSFTDYDVYLLREGKHLYSYEKMGAHPREVDGVKGVNFAVWAPNALRISVIGNLNHWDARTHPMRPVGDSGFWELFIPDIGEGEIYRYHVKSRHDNFTIEKSDPYGFHSEMRPKNASIVANIEGYEWGDEAWMEARAKQDNLNSPMSIYEVHLGSWKRKQGGGFKTYRELADELVSYVKDLGYTHIELMPIAEHPLDMSWGYQVTGYYAPTSRFGQPKDFMYFVDQCHQNNIGVILDWVPAHFPKDGHGLSYFDGTHLYEHEHPLQREHPDWGTLIFNYGRNEVRNFLISNALFWLKHYHCDGLRVDAVSSMIYLDFSRQPGQWIPNKHGGRENLDAIEFIREFNKTVYAECPGAVTIAEESTSWPMISRPVYVGGLGFTFKWDMGWMHDTLKYIALDPIFRRYHHNQITFSMFYAFNENFILSLSHDEVVHLKGSLITKAAGDWWQKFATLRLLFGYQYTHSGKKLNFMGQEFGQWREWSEARELDWNLLDFPTHQGLKKWTQDLNHFYVTQPALYERDLDWDGFKWIEANDADNSTFSYIRFAKDMNEFIVVIVNFTPVPLKHYRLGVPADGYYVELLNSDAGIYGGGNVGNGGGVQSKPEKWGEFGHTLELTVPPLGMVALKRRVEG
ncbi:MAG: 1,4-alpha-glucan branching protein GlgB [Anaerolineae bacterium]